LPWSQDKLADSASSSGNVSFHHFPSQVEIEALNPHRPPSLNYPTPTSTAIKMSSQP
jgi:hypothetical protein